MLHKLALLAASLVAALVIAGGLALAGFGPAQPTADATQVVDATASVDTPPPVQVDTIYLTPEATPRDVTVTKVRVATRRGGEDDEHEGNDD